MSSNSRRGETSKETDGHSSTQCLPPFLPQTFRKGGNRKSATFFWRLLSIENTKTSPLLLLASRARLDSQMEWHAARDSMDAKMIQNLGESKIRLS